MSLDKARLAAAIIAKLKSDGFTQLDSAPKMQPANKSGVEIMIDDIAEGVVTEIDVHYDGGTGTDSILNSLVGPGVPTRDSAGDWAMALDLLTQAAADSRYSTPSVE